MSDLQPPEGEGYDLQAVYSENARPFWFRWADTWWQIPHLRMLDFEAQVAVESFDYSGLTDGSADLAKMTEKVNDLFDLIMGVEQGQRWRTVPRPLSALMDIINKWIAHSGGKPGESAASDDSSKSTGRPSKPTLTATTASGSRRRSTAKTAGTTRRGKS